MGAIVVVMYGLTAWTAQAQTSHAAPAARAGHARVATAEVRDRRAAETSPATQVTTLLRSARALLGGVRTADATLSAPAELSGTIHGHRSAAPTHHVGVAHVGDDFDACDSCDSCDSCDKHHSCRCWRCCVRSTCDMVPHAWYRYPESHGYYYFRPYHYTHVDLQREFITSIGGDHRSPYVDGLFEDIYREMEGR